MAESKSKRMVIHITPTMHERVKQAAAQNNMSMSEFIRMSVDERLDVVSAYLGVTTVLRESEKTREY